MILRFPKFTILHVSGNDKIDLKGQILKFVYKTEIQSKNLSLEIVCRDHSNTLRNFAGNILFLVSQLSLSRVTNYPAQPIFDAVIFENETKAESVGKMSKKFEKRNKNL